MKPQLFEPPLEVVVFASGATASIASPRPHKRIVDRMDELLTGIDSLILFNQPRCRCDLPRFTIIAPIASAT